jgi:hypothetical protein
MEVGQYGPGVPDLQVWGLSQTLYDLTLDLTNSGAPASGRPHGFGSTQ